MCFLFIVLSLISCTKSFAEDTSEAFDVRTTLIGFTFKQEKKIRSASRQFADNQGLSNEAIYKKILAGSERMTSHGPNNTMDLEIELYTDHDSITIGYTYPSIVRIYMNRKYFNKFRPYQVADNMMHEWLHKVGFGHSVKDTPERPYSVPYAVGYIVKGIAREMRKSRLLTELNAIADKTPLHE